MKYLSLILVVMVAVGCRPYDVPEYKQVGNSETAFLVPEEGDTEAQVSYDSEEYLRQNKVAIKRVRIPHRWNQTGRLWFSGEWIPTLRLVKVDRQPVTRKWTVDDHAIWVESSDSIEFSMAIESTSRIRDDDSAVKFLFNYPEDSLANVMDDEIRGQVQTSMGEFAANYSMDDLRSKKNEMIQHVKDHVLPFFENRGIHITNLGLRGGMVYKSESIQTSINQVFEAQQDEEVAKAETVAQLERNKAILLAAEGKAEAVKKEAAGKAEAIRSIADAKSYEMEKAAENHEMYLNLKQLELEGKRLERWDGKYPTYMGTEMPSLLKGVK